MARSCSPNAKSGDQGGEISELAALVAGLDLAVAAAGAAVVVHYRSGAERAASVVGDIIARGGRAVSA